MEALNEATVPAQILMTGERHIGILGSLNIDLAQNVLLSANRSFGRNSLESAMALHWAAAASLSTDSPILTSAGIAQLDAAPEPLRHFGHQRTIRKLLLITPQLGFDMRLRRAWVRRALYENAFRTS
jgi:hypothetical protein